MIDDLDNIRSAFQNLDGKVCVKKTREAFIQSGVTQDEEVKDWLLVIQKLNQKSLPQALYESKQEILLPEDGVYKAAFSKRSYYKLAKALQKSENELLKNEFSKLLPILGPVRKSIEEKLKEFDFFKVLRGHFLHTCKKYKWNREQSIQLAKALECLWKHKIICSYPSVGMIEMAFKDFIKEFSNEEELLAKKVKSCVPLLKELAKKTEAINHYKFLTRIIAKASKFRV